MPLNRQPFVAQMYSLNNNGPDQLHIHASRRRDKQAQHGLFRPRPH